MKIDRVQGFLSIFFLMAAAVFGRGGSGSFEGVVTDSTGAVAPGVIVTVTNMATNVPRVAKTSAEGLYAAPFLQPGTYKVKVERSGFSALERSGIRVRVDEAVAEFKVETNALSAELWTRWWADGS